MTTHPTDGARNGAAPVNGIKATMFHDEGAISCCGYCGRYSLDPKTLGDRAPACECGKEHGWSSSFKTPGPDAKWAGAAPASLHQPLAAGGALTEALTIAEAALADIGDADREPGDDVAWCERRAAEALPIVRAALSAQQAEVAPVQPEYECCGSPVVGATYMGQQEMVCCGNYEPTGAAPVQPTKLKPADYSEQYAGMDGSPYPPVQPEPACALCGFAEHVSSCPLFVYPDAAPVRAEQQQWIREIIEWKRKADLYDVAPAQATQGAAEPSEYLRGYMEAKSEAAAVEPAPASVRERAAEPTQAAPEPWLRDLLSLACAYVRYTGGASDGSDQRCIAEARAALAAQPSGEEKQS